MRQALLAFILLLTSCATFAKELDGYPRLMQGPLLGAVTPTDARIWVRASGPHDLAVEYWTEAGQKMQSAPVRTKKENDWCATIQVDGLQPATSYQYQILLDGEPARYLFDDEVNPTKCSLTTAPPVGTPNNFKLMFGSCARWQEDRVQPIWEGVAKQQPDLFFWIGDNIYGDSPDPQILAEEYRRQREVALLQPLLYSVPQFAIWDDHDYGLNNQDKSSPVKEEALAVLKQYWPNPSFGLPDTPGCFFKHSYGAVDFFMLDCRYYRDTNEEPSSPEKTFLGKEQLAWLKQGLKDSTAVFRLLVCGSGWNVQKGPDGDSWSSSLHERNALFDFIRDENIEGVLLLSGDTHVGELNCIPWSANGGYDLYELVASPLAQKPSKSSAMRSPEVRMRPAYLDTVNAGLLEFTFDADPQVTLNLINPTGATVYDPIVIKRSELKNGVESFKSKNPVNIARTQ